MHAHSKYWDRQSKPNCRDPDQTSQNMTSDQGRVVQSFVSLMSSLVVKMLIVLVNTISDSQLFLLK